MKKFIALALVTLGITVSARAQWIVFDPTMNVQSILNTAREIAKYVEMINNHVQQIQTLTDQLNEFKHHEDLFGDPKAVLLTTVQPLVNDLRKTEVGQTLTRRHRECPWICVPARHSKQQTIVQFSEQPRPGKFASMWA